MLLPDFLEPVRLQGFELFEHNCTREIAFSGPTYQVEILDPAIDMSAWVFLQLDASHEVKDVFCSCDASSEKGICPHMACACFAIFDQKFQPLHVRFAQSFWHALFYLLFEKSRFGTYELVQESRGYAVKGSDGALLFWASSALQDFLAKRKQETEETSIKFSNLSDEELMRWREGRPSPQLSYELSLFSDIAKKLFLDQCEGKSISCIFVEKECPESVNIQSDTFSIEAYLDADALVRLIPTLNTVSSSLILNTKEIVAIDFDERRGVFEVEKALIPPKGATSLGAWWYVQGSGFWPKDTETEHVKLSDSKEIASFLCDHSQKVAEFLPQIPLHNEPQEVSYDLFFDAKSTFHIKTFLKKRDDLEKNSFIWHGWLYSKEYGFVAIANAKFFLPHVVVTTEEMVSFITQHRAWLSTFSGFTVHVTKLSEEITYEVDTDAALIFRSHLVKFKKAKERIDFGSWIWVKDDGFYMQHFSQENPPLPMGKKIFRHDVADFIRHHGDILRAVPNFFAASCPIKDVGIQVGLRRRDEIALSPQYSWHDPHDQKRAIFYDEFVFVPSIGFYRLEPSFRPLHFARSIKADDPSVWNAFFLETLPKLRQEYSCEVDPRLEIPQQLQLTVVPQGKEKESLSEYDLDILYKSQKGEIALSELIRYKKMKNRFVPTDAGLLDLHEDRYHWIDHFEVKPAKSPAKGIYNLNSQDFFKLSAYDSIHVETTQESVKKSFSEVLEKLLHLKPVKPPVLSQLCCELRPYQRHGVEWLWFLYQHRLSGLLCDDMGVGKTHQAMGLMDAIFTSNKKKKSLFLIICPTSLIYHWQDKLLKYLPSLKVKLYVRQDRTLSDFPDEYDIMLTSYGIWRNEALALKKYRFDAAVFDELQIAKNHISQIHAALLHVQAEVKIGLTGTPIENQLRELKAVFDLVFYGYMPKESDFRNFFIRPIEKMANDARKRLLSRYIRPFVLRRRKVDVLPDLPEKSEENYVTELVGEQKNLYRHVASQQALPLIQQLKDESMPIPYMHIFAVISSLKQICNHPATYLKDTNFERYESGKWEGCMELLEEAMESEQKVVIFSQYLAMLDIIEAYLKKKHIGFSQIRGQTKNRGAEVAKFQEDSSCKVFLGSLQAAGLGIDLTSASVVIHYDRWWNPARENQATDRVHRFGQKRGVQVFKLVTKSTIEEKIDRMIEKKKGLLEDVVFFDDHQIVKRLTREEIISLLEGVTDM